LNLFHSLDDRRYLSGEVKVDVLMKMKRLEITACRVKKLTLLVLAVAFSQIFKKMVCVQNSGRNFAIVGGAMF
jgi:hypothetical protein